MLPWCRWKLDCGIVRIDLALCPRPGIGQIALILPCVAELRRIGSGNVVVPQPSEHVAVAVGDERHRAGGRHGVNPELRVVRGGRLEGVVVGQPWIVLVQVGAVGGGHHDLGAHGQRDRVIMPIHSVVGAVSLVVDERERPFTVGLILQLQAVSEPEGCAPRAEPTPVLG